MLPALDVCDGSRKLFPSQSHNFNLIVPARYAEPNMQLFQKGAREKSEADCAIIMTGDAVPMQMRT